MDFPLSGGHKISDNREKGRQIGQKLLADEVKKAILSLIARLGMEARHISISRPYVGQYKRVPS